MNEDWIPESTDDEHRLLASVEDAEEIAARIEEDLEPEVDEALDLLAYWVDARPLLASRASRVRAALDAGGRRAALALRRLAGLVERWAEAGAERAYGLAEEVPARLPSRAAPPVRRVA